ncbi:uncharacterized protein PV07_12815 [Cladophialophora immunda]|uniref:Uncharacterized protein n=2 Tax=Cladophialophora immunda TaxID=569365 RepID=A0A0D2BTK5_9EURO|nr:uncharacterized protein PV07_12815 [Cladophialophora immunda]KIW21755.1 hypothetical protein PV07_12815 [Cladophialophora immunda]
MLKMKGWMMNINQAKEKWASAFEKAYAFVEDDDKRRARKLCNDLLQEPGIHLFYQVKCHLMLAALADIPPVAETPLDEADKLCIQLYESRKDGEEEEILIYQAIIASGKENLGPEMKEWKMEEGIYYISSSEED